ncbi:hypothetical protein BCV70DRAFT_201945 [Testicularia cyperi]|uniref:Uncharacterized protein n=1 Tax=Testicularia cyperi TaxID=1882483 RepID=A0A317XK08_9BASI|nr:hypothetical protein BCV70DRAFT_201945 [Testicularia cyperi]
MSDPAQDPFAHARPNWSQSALTQGGTSTDQLPLAATADVLKCYEEAVQEPLVECVNLDSLYSGAQLDSSDRFDARILREDFCSTAVIATTWLSIDQRNQSQGVDIDLVALQDTQRRLQSRHNLVQLLQSPAYSGKDTTQVLQPETVAQFATEPATSTEAPPAGSASTSGSQIAFPSDTWAPGAATERFDRKRNKKLAKEAKKEAAKAATAAAAASSPDKFAPPSTNGPRMKLLHSDVLDLPVPPTDNESGTSALEPPDIIASLNYAMAYFHDRATLIRYLRMAKQTLRPKTGVFITDMFGGPSTGESYPNQDETWSRFQGEVGFDRQGGDGRHQQVLQADRSPNSTASDGMDGALSTLGRKRSQKPNGSPGNHHEDKDQEPQGVLEVMSAPPAEALGTRSEWPRGKLKLVRTGTQHGGFEYWREDGPVDWMSNRFRMSLSFRFSDASWLRDVFWYDFRVWSIKELVEAMEEAGLVRVKVHILPRNIVDDDQVSEIGENDSERPPSPIPEGDIATGRDNDDGLDDMANLLLRTEKEERNKSFYRDVKPGEKVFANRSFGTYIVACAP